MGALKPGKTVRAMRVAHAPRARHECAMAEPPVLLLNDIHLTFGGDSLFEGAALSVGPRDRIALVGRNGSGKSTLLKIAAGLVDFDSGERFVQPGVAVSYLHQEPDLSAFETLRDYIDAGLGPTQDGANIAPLLEGLGLSGDQACATASGGEARRAAIIRALIAEPDILLLDEPTNHLDLPSIGWLEHHIKQFRGAMVLISHDRRFLENLSTRTVWVDRGATKSLNRGFAFFEDWRDKTLEEEELAHHKLGRKIVAEEHWMRYGVTARRKRNMRRVGELQALRKQLRERKAYTGQVNFTATQSGPSGKRVIVAENISKSFGGRPIVDGFSIEVNRGDRIGIVGPNGAGKSTLIKMLTGDLAPDDGAIKIGTNLDIISLDQNRSSLTPNMRVADAISDGRGDFVMIAEQKKTRCQLSSRFFVFSRPMARPSQHPVGRRARAPGTSRRAGAPVEHARA